MNDWQIYQNNMRHSQAQIIATIGPATDDRKTVRELFDRGCDAFRLNFSWGSHEEHARYISFVRNIAQETGKRILIIQDLSGPRKQKDSGHAFDASSAEILTAKDLDDLAFGIKHGVDYIAQSFVGSAQDILRLKEEIFKLGGSAPVIAKIERAKAIRSISEIVEAADAIMIARGDLGNEVPLEDIPLIEKDIINECKLAAKPVIVATQMLFSMIENPLPTRAEITDVEFAILSGADAVMLSDETAMGKYPADAVEVMEKAILAAEERMASEGKLMINPL